MKISLQEIPVSDLIAGYSESETTGVKAYGGNLDIRPPYQREFVYKDDQRDEVIRSILNDRPLNVLYWSVNKSPNTGQPDGTYECMDGQQRMISICRFANGDFSVDFRYIHNLRATDPVAYKQFMDYKLMVYFCDGTETEKLDWFQTINIAGEKLTEQEMRNAIYHGPWVTDAKKYFSKPNCPAARFAQDYMSGSPIRQDYLATVLEWICDKERIAHVKDYMAIHQNDPSAISLWVYFQNVINWAQVTFPNTDKSRMRLMRGLPWGIWYNEFCQKSFDPVQLEADIVRLLQDEDVTNQKGIYHYLLDGDSKWLNIRMFSERDKQRKYEEQGGICPKCGQHFEYDEMDGDHIVPWEQGGKTEYSNLQMLCIGCNRSGK